jgi:hypothetical protein
VHTLIIGLGMSLLALIMWFAILSNLPFGKWPDIGPIHMNCTSQALFRISSGSQAEQEFWPVNSTDINMNEFIMRYRPCGRTEGMTSAYNWTSEIMYRPAGWQSLPVIFTLFPMGLFIHDLETLGAMSANGTETAGYGLKMHNVSSYCKTNSTSGKICDENYSVGSSWGVLFGVYLFYSLLALWFDNVLPNAMGMRKNPWYFLLPSYWGFRHDSPLMQQRPDIIGVQSNLISSHIVYASHLL